ncbi:MAG: energy transducer TonB [Fibrobacteres bacterium]|nr:energy transducer TonB [Fibrobacterota bacterium]
MTHEQEYILREIQLAAGGSTYKNRAFQNIFAVSCIIFISAGIALYNTKFSPVARAAAARKISITVALENEQKKKVPAPPKPVVKQKPVDLTKDPKLNATKTVVVEKKEQLREVYGLKKVYAVGLGAGGSGDGSDAIVSKLGNTLEKDPDTIKATEQELKGPVTSVATVTTKPVIEKAVKPEYTDEMKQNRVQGVVSARILIDIDGAVKRVEILNDLGFGTKEAVEKACQELRFKPAMEGDKPVATWIVFKFRFVLQE